MKKTISFLLLLTMLVSFVFVFTACDYNCKTCHDKHTVVCRDCNGKKEKKCSFCGGDGMRPCVLCNGTGSRTCISCGGMGGRYEYDFFSKMNVYRTCYSCVGGRISCIATTVCSCTDGKMSCGTCLGQGSIVCPDCPTETTGVHDPNESV